MRRFHHVFAIVLLLGLGPAALRAQDRDTRTLSGVEDEWAGALVRRDTTTLRRFLAPGFVYTEDDRTTDRDAVLRDVAAGPDTVEAARNEGVRVHRIGTAAAVTGWLIVRGRGARGPFEHRYRFTDTWVFRGGRWQVVAAQDYALSPIQAQPVESSGFWDRYGKDTVFALLGVVLGSIVSFYGTMLFERYKRFREILLDISQARQLNDAYPTEIKNLEPVYLRATSRSARSREWHGLKPKRRSADERKVGRQDRGRDRRNDRHRARNDEALSPGRSSRHRDRGALWLQVVVYGGGAWLVMRRRRSIAMGSDHLRSH